MRESAIVRKRQRERERESNSEKDRGRDGGRTRKTKIKGLTVISRPVRDSWPYTDLRETL